jgi:acetyl-CoA carboxylase biotin carboxyl carrier protein
MDLRKLKTLIELVESSGVAELEIQEGEERVRITRAFAASSPPRSCRHRLLCCSRGTAGGTAVPQAVVAPTAPPEPEGHW